MTLNEIVSRAASAYPDGFVLAYWDSEKQEPRENPNGGDTLAQFIAIELFETFDDEATDEEQLRMAIGKMRSAEEDLHKVVAALQNLAQERKDCNG